MPELENRYPFTAYDWTMEIIGALLLLSTAGMAYYYDGQMAAEMSAALEAGQSSSIPHLQPNLWKGVIGSGVLYMFLTLCSLVPGIINHDPTDSPENIRATQVLGVKFIRGLKMFIAAGGLFITYYLVREASLA